MVNNSHSGEITTMYHYILPYFVYVKVSPLVSCADYYLFSESVSSVEWKVQKKYQAVSCMES